MESQAIINAIAHKFKVDPRQVFKLMDVPETYQLGAQRYNVVYVDELNERVAEKLRDNMHTVYRELGVRNFFRFCGLSTPLDPDDQVIFNYLHNVPGKKGSKYLTGLIKDIPAFISQTSAHIGYCAMMGASDCIEVVVHSQRMYMFILRGTFPPIEDAADLMTPPRFMAPDLTTLFRTVEPLPVPPDAGQPTAAPDNTQPSPYYDRVMAEFAPTAAPVAPDAEASEPEDIPF